MLAEAIDRLGPAGVLAPILLVIGFALLRFPGAALTLLVAGAVLVEAEGRGILPPSSGLYDVAVLHLTPQDMLLLVGLAGVLLRFATDGRRPLLPEPLNAPLALLFVALVAGVATGYTAHADVSNGDLFHRSMTACYVILVPLLTVNVLRGTEALRLFVAVAAALAIFKGASGLYAALSGIGEAVESETISYLNPVPNLIMLVFVLGVAAALVRRVALPAWILAGAPVAALALLLSYRRSFWIAGAITLVVVVVLASRNRGRTVLAVAAVVLAVAAVGIATLGPADDPRASPIVERARTLSPSGLGTNRGDRYRIDERHNVIANLRDHPLTGIGLGVPWEVHSPLAESHDRRYAHIALLWFWLAFGPLGVLAYVALLGTGLWTATRIWRRHPDRVIQVAGLACFGGLLALAIVELTATFTAIEPRTSILLGAALGWLAAAWRDLPPGEDGPPAAVRAAP